MSSRFISPFYDVGSGIKPPSGARLFFFETDGTTPKDTFSDQLSTPTANTNPVIANSNGVFGNIFITGQYKVTLQDKNGSQIFGLEFVEELVTGSEQLVNVLSRDTLDAAVIDTSLQAGLSINLKERTAGNGGGAMWDVVLASSVTPNTFNIVQCVGVPTLALVLRKDAVPTVKQYGATGDGVTDDTAAIQAAVTDNLGSELFFNAGTYVISDELLIPFIGGSGTVLKGESRVNTKLVLTGVSNKALFRLSSSRCTISDMRLEGAAGQTGNTAIKFAPEDEAQTTLRVAQDRNIIHSMVIGGTWDLGILLKTGPDVGGGDSSCFFNTITKIDLRDNTNGGIKLTDGVNAGSSPSNRNTIQNCEFSGNMNFGIHNEGADTTKILDNDFEGVDFATGPLATATAIKIDQLAPNSGKDNANVIIDNCTYELCDRHIDNANLRTMVTNSNHDTTLCLFTNQPLIITGGRDYSTTTQRLPGYRYQTNSQEAFPNSRPVFDTGIYLDEDQSPLENYEAETPSTPSLGVFTPFLADNSDSDSEGQVYSKQVGVYTRIGNRCFFDIRLRTTSTGTLTGSETAKICGLPFTSKALTDYTASANAGFAQLINLDNAGGVSGIITNNTTCISMRYWDLTTGTSNLTIDEWSADGDVAISGSYEVE